MFDVWVRDLCSCLSPSGQADGFRGEVLLILLVRAGWYLGFSICGGFMCLFRGVGAVGGGAVSGA